MAFRALTPAEFEWIERPHEPGEPPRRVARLSERMEFTNTPANVWRYESGAKGVRHRARGEILESAI